MALSLQILFQSNHKIHFIKGWTNRMDDLKKSLSEICLTKGVEFDTLKKMRYFYL